MSINRTFRFVGMLSLALLMALVGLLATVSGASADEPRERDRQPNFEAKFFQDFDRPIIVIQPGFRAFAPRFGFEEDDFGARFFAPRFAPRFGFDRDFAPRFAPRFCFGAED